MPCCCGGPVGMEQNHVSTGLSPALGGLQEPSARRKHLGELCSSPRLVMLLQVGRCAQSRQRVPSLLS